MTYADSTPSIRWGKAIVVVPIIAIFTFLLAGCSVTEHVEVHGANTASWEGIHSIAILPFENPYLEQTLESPPGISGIQMLYRDAGVTVSDSLAVALLDVVPCKVYERTQLVKILEEKNLELSELVARKSAADIGKLIGVDAIVVGKVSQYETWVDYFGYDYHFMFQARIVRVADAFLLCGISASGGGNDLPQAENINNACQKICQKIGLELQQKIPAKR